MRWRTHRDDMADLGGPVYLMVVPRNAQVVVVTEGEPLFGERFDAIAVLGEPDPEWVEMQVNCRLKPTGTMWVQ